MGAMSPLESAAQQARQEGLQLRQLSIDTRNRFLEHLAHNLSQHHEEILQANKQDLEQAKSEKLSAPLLKRLDYSAQKISESVQGLMALSRLPDPLGKVLEARLLDDGLELFKISVPIGVIALIFESRPDALIQMAGLCWKSGNAVILKGGREALRTNRALFEVIQQTLAELALPQHWIVLTETRDEVNQILKLERWIDLIIPRGSNEFVRYIMDNTRIPVLGHADGIVHLYLHDDAPTQMAVDLVVDSKTQYVAVCNALETLLVHQDSAIRLLPELARALQAKQVRLKGCERTRAILPGLEEASEDDWNTEYLDSILSIKIVDDLQKAIDHINTHGSHHTDGIVTLDVHAAKTFMDLVDSADVFWNASTRFSDGYRYGLGAEVGIATGKLHARGPMGLEGLVTSQWRLFGHGHLVGDYSSGFKTFKHTDLGQQDYFKKWIT